MRNVHKLQDGDQGHLARHKQTLSSWCCATSNLFHKHSTIWNCIAGLNKKSEAIDADSVTFLNSISEFVEVAVNAAPDMKSPQY